VGGFDGVSRWAQPRPLCAECASGRNSLCKPAIVSAGLLRGALHKPPPTLSPKSSHLGFRTLPARFSSMGLTPQQRSNLARPLDPPSQKTMFRSSVTRSRNLRILVATPPSTPYPHPVDLQSLLDRTAIGTRDVNTVLGRCRSAKPKLKQTKIIMTHLLESFGTSSLKSVAVHAPDHSNFRFEFPASAQQSTSSTLATTLEQPAGRRRDTLAEVHV